MAALLVVVGACSLAAPADEELVGSCQDNLQNGDETDVDCGGSASGCGPCGVGQGCRQGSDCSSSTCDGTACGIGNCSDGAKNGTEGDIDCGGDCPAWCEEGETCNSEIDCEFWCETTADPPVCTGDTCNDGEKNGGETDTDCGGPFLCNTCLTGEGCEIDDDCDSLICSDGICATSCDNGMVDGTESDVDCGGFDVVACPRCQIGQTCYENFDCATGVICDQNTLQCQ
jgi:hypothetical protein